MRDVEYRIRNYYVCYIYLRISEGGSKNVHFLMFYFYNRKFEHDANYPDASKQFSSILSNMGYILTQKLGELVR